MLDFSKSEVVDYIYGQMRKILTEAPVSYIKWDMNRAFSEVFSNGNDRAYQGKVRHNYILGGVQSLRAADSGIPGRAL